MIYDITINIIASLLKNSASLFAPGFASEETAMDDRQHRLVDNHLQGGAPPSDVCWAIIPINYRYNPLINPRYWSYKLT